MYEIYENSFATNLTIIQKSFSKICHLESTTVSGTHG